MTGARKKLLSSSLLGLMACWAMASAPSWAEPDYSAAIKADPGYDTLKARPMWVEKITDGLYVIRGPITVDDKQRAPLPPVSTTPQSPGGVAAHGVQNARPPDMLPHEPSDTTVRVTPAGVILVDSKTTDETAASILQLVKTITPLPVKYLITTHYHLDHTGGVPYMMAHGVQVVMQENLRRDYEKAKRGGGSPEITFGNYGAIYLGGVKVEMYHFGNAHTEGDTMVYFPDLKAVCTGDAVIDGIPHFDYRGGGGSALGHVTVIDNLLQLDFAVAIPSHGRLLTKDYIRDYVKDVETMNDRMMTLVRNGVPKDVGAITKALKTDDLRTASTGIYWNHSVSTNNTMTNDLLGYYDEMAAAIAAEKDDQPMLVESNGFSERYNKIVDIPH